MALTTEKTVHYSLTAAAISHQFPEWKKPFVCLVTSNRAYHVRVNKAGTVADTVSAPFISTGCSHVRVNPGDTLSVVLASGEVDGDVWLTPQLEE